VNRLLFGLLIGTAALAACSGTPATCGRGPGAPEGALQPVNLLAPRLAYPIPSATNVALALGDLVFSGDPATGLQLQSTIGPVPVGSPTAAPSPLPTPIAPPGPGAPLTYFALPIPTLSPSTTYSVTWTYLAPADNPPSCKASVTQNLGSFTT
jgi:hypothetical protein